ASPAGPSADTERRSLAHFRVVRYPTLVLIPEYHEFLDFSEARSSECSSRSDVALPPGKGAGGGDRSAPRGHLNLPAAGDPRRGSLGLSGRDGRDHGSGGPRGAASDRLDPARTAQSGCGEWNPLLSPG